MPARIDQLSPVHRPDLDDRALLSLFERPVRKRPWLRVNFVASVDGAATLDGLSGALGGPADKRLFDLLRRPADVVLVAAGTVRAEGYGPMVLDAESVAWREAAGLAPQPVFALVSGSLNLDPRSRVFTEAPVRPIVLTRESAPTDRRAALSEVAEVISCGVEAFDPKAAVAALVERALPQIHCEGGPSLFGALLASDVVDELCLTVAPTLASGGALRIAHADASVDRPQYLAHVLSAEDTLLLRYLRAR
ncbi:pyrimidine reductase family protein [Microbacteriaceae bacterium VKM Ac-2854]|nr:pyrimidine reductase family protein [Microbacteriaceae bacterium VKM Ac-2854]